MSRCAHVRLCIAVAGSSLALCAASASARYEPVPGDYIIASQFYDTIYAVDPATGLIRSLISGTELRLGLEPVVRGSGSRFGNGQIELSMNRQGRLFARIGYIDDPYFGLVEIDPATGDRTIVQASTDDVWRDGGSVQFISRNQFLGCADGFENQGRGRLLRHDLMSSETQVLSDSQIGNGPLFQYPHHVQAVNSQTCFVAEWPSHGPTGAFLVDQHSGARTFLSRLKRQNLVREVIEDGVSQGQIVLGDDEGGAGPIFEEGIRSALCVSGRIFVTGSSVGGNRYYGAVIEIDPTTGDRKLIAGSALADDAPSPTIVHAPASKGINIDSPCGLTLTSRGTLAFVLRFTPALIYELEVDTGELTQVANIAAQLRPATATSFTGLTIVPHPADINGDQRVNNADLSVMLSQFNQSGNDIAADINADGVVNNLDLSIFLAGFGWGVD